MFPLVEAYQKSDLNRQAFCELHGITISTLGYWVGRYRRSKEQENESDFVQISLGDPSNHKYMMEVQSKQGIVFRFSSLVPTNYLSRLLEL